jgi:endonuclease G
MLKKRSKEKIFKMHFANLRLLTIAVSLFVSIVTIFAQEPSVYRPKFPQYDNLKYGVPGPADTIIEREGYALGYIEKHEQPSWVCYIVTKEELSTRVAKRTNNFRADPAIPTGSAHPADYTRSGFDRGHLAPAADMSFSAETMSESFFMSNMSPQRPQFNRGIWGKLEKQIRYFANRERMIVVVTGPILPDTPTITIGQNKVTVPEYYYKVVYDLTPPQKMIGFVLPNKGSQKPLASFAVTVDHVEKLTGLDFFSLVPKQKQEELEKTISVESWAWFD